MKILIGAMILLGAIAGTLANALAAEIHLEKEIEQLPAKITNVYNCGHWASDKDEGFFRVVYVEYFYGCSLLYIQWVKDFTSKDPTRHVMHTLSIQEFNADDHIELTFDRPECKETKDGIQFDMVAESGHDGKKHRFDLQVHSAFGKYSMKEENKNRTP
jgi:hypothetical protein